MVLSRFRVTLLAVAATAVTAFGNQAPAGPWPPPPGKGPAGSPPLSPAEAMATFTLAPGYRIELVASEPLVQDPIAMDWDPQGRLWVVEMPGFVPNLAAPEPYLEPVGRIVVLQDSDGDGRMDTRTVFADGLVLARSVKALDHGILVAEPPNVWLMHDTDGDLRMDTKELVTDQYGSREARVEQNANAFDWGLDNWMHTSNSDIDLRWTSGGFEVRKSLLRGEWGATHDDAGRVYRNTNESSVHVDFVPTPYYSRNPNLLRTRGSYEALGDDENLVNVVWPARPNPGTNRAYQLGIDRPDGTLFHFTSVCSPLIYRGDRLPSDAYGNVFVAEPAANLVSRIVLEDDGTTLRARKAYEKGEFLASTDERFRPVFLSNAPDGTLYIVDMYRGVIQQRADITEYLRDYIVSHKLEDPTGLGRIYRVVHESPTRDTTRLGEATPARLVELLSHPSGWWRDTAQRLLVERHAVESVPALTKLAASSGDWRVKLHALWTLDGLDALEPRTVIVALEDPSKEVRASALRLSERWLATPDETMRAAVMKRLDDPDWWVREQLAASLGTLPQGTREAALVSVLDRYAGDPVVLDAALSGLRGSEATALEDLLQASGPQTPQRDAALTMLAATVVRGGQDVAMQRVFGWAADEARPAWQRSDLLRGAEVAVLGAAMPGGSGRRNASPVAQAPCPTCPGARGGPGGAYAFPQAPRTPPVRRVVRLRSEPEALAGLARQAEGLGPRAAALLARIEWPGKPGASAPVAPLTAEERARFDLGHGVYQNICQSCHQPDGRGQDRLAPSLVGSRLALAPAEVPIRILLNGKEGAIGLMPPVGSTLSDDQIAGVLTYVRREWGQEGSPVTPAQVEAVRAANSNRTKPWTDAELLAIAQGDGRRP
jgi:mono/diheme cytochrome c family protein/glucose/arabinose dehydrogenase